MPRLFGRIAALLAVVATVVPVARAQQSQPETINELGGLVGRTFVGDQTITSGPTPGTLRFGDGTTFEINYARHLITHDTYGLSLEIPAVFNLGENLNYSSNATPKSYSSFFITPSARVNLFPHYTFSPWGSIGGGLAHFSESSTLVFGGPNPGNTGTTAGAFQVGGGVDINAWKFVSIRFGVRLFNTGSPTLNVNTGRLNNVFVGGGVVWHF
jgi:opacity protein-like surface antigen